MRSQAWSPLAPNLAKKIRHLISFAKHMMDIHMPLSPKKAPNTTNNTSIYMKLHLGFVD